MHEAVQRAVIGRNHVPAEAAHVIAGKVHTQTAERARRILSAEGTNLNAFVGACVALLVEDYERATQG